MTLLKTIKIKMIYSLHWVFCDQPSSKGLRSLNPMEVAELCGFPLDITTRWFLKLVKLHANRFSDQEKSLFREKFVVAEPKFII